MSRFTRILGALLALASFISLPLFGADGERFSVAIGSHENLLIAGPGGDTVADMAGQIVGERVTVANTTLQVSYGRDANGQLTAVLATPDLKSDSLHFSAGGRSIDSDKAVVTLTFSSDLKSVQIDPGYVGTVEVDSHVLRAHRLADEVPIPAAALAATPSDAVMPDLATPTTVAETTAAPSPAPATSTSGSTPSAPTETASVAATPSSPETASAPAPLPPPTTSTVAQSPTSTQTESSATQPGAFSGAPPLLASQLKPILAPLPNAAPTTPQEQPPYESGQKRLLGSASALGQDGAGAASQVKFFWSEPVTAPDGSAPPVSPDQIKLVEVYGMVTVTLPGGADQIGTEGMIVPSGATVRTADGSSAALFMGGVNSARLMPRCELTVTQTLAGSVRTDVIHLQSGAVFSRIGHLEGETENYSVVTPEGTLQPETSDMLTFRGTPRDLRGITTTRSGLDLNATALLAWDPAPSRGLISDVPGWNVGISKAPDKGCNTYSYSPYGSGPNLSGNIGQQVLTCTGGGAGPNDGGSNPEPQYVLQQILETLQPFNKKLQGVLTAINDGDATTAQTDFYLKLTTVFFDVQEPGLVDQFDHNPKQFDRNEDRYRRILCQDLQEVGTPALTPH